MSSRNPQALGGNGFLNPIKIGSISGPWRGLPRIKSMELQEAAARFSKGDRFKAPDGKVYQITDVSPTSV